MKARFWSKECMRMRGFLTSPVAKKLQCFSVEWLTSIYAFSKGAIMLKPGGGGKYGEVEILKVPDPKTQRNLDLYI